MLQTGAARARLEFAHHGCRSLRPAFVPGGRGNLGGMLHDTLSHRASSRLGQVFSAMCRCRGRLVAGSTERRTVICCGRPRIYSTGALFVALSGNQLVFANRDFAEHCPLITSPSSSASLVCVVLASSLDCWSHAHLPEAPKPMASLALVRRSSALFPGYIAALGVREESCSLHTASEGARAGVGPRTCVTHAAVSDCSEQALGPDEAVHHAGALLARCIAAAMLSHRLHSGWQAGHRLHSQSSQDRPPRRPHSPARACFDAPTPAENAVSPSCQCGGHISL